VDGNPRCDPIEEPSDARPVTSGGADGEEARPAESREGLGAARTPQIGEVAGVAPERSISQMRRSLVSALSGAPAPVHQAHFRSGDRWMPFPVVPLAGSPCGLVRGKQASVNLIGQSDCEGNAKRSQVQGLEDLLGLRLKMASSRCTRPIVLTLIQ